MLKYQKFIFEIEFEKEVYFNIYPTFLFRSLLGKELKKLSCLFKDRKCVQCDLKYQCAYSKLFETPIPKDNDFLKGRNFASHPVIIYSDAKYKKNNDKANLEIVLIGDAINYLPYVYYAFKEAGKIGIERERIKYQIHKIYVNNELNILEYNKINTEFEIKEWNLALSQEHKQYKKNINLKTPLRLKINGHFVTDFSYTDLLVSALRRVNILENMYGSLNKIEMDFNTLKLKKEYRNFHWLELYRHSSRQKRGMKLGGIVGNLIVEGEFSDFEISLLMFIELFNLGKNISFGLGNVEIR